jgi:hypothetical protein
VRLDCGALSRLDSDIKSLRAYYVESESDDGRNRGEDVLWFSCRVAGKVSDEA